jgi:hypothetical protein
MWHRVARRKVAKEETKGVNSTVNHARSDSRRPGLDLLDSTE